MKRHTQGLFVGLVALFTLGGTAHAAEFLVNERNASSIWKWNSSGASSVYHTVRANDADLNVAEGSPDGWFAEHFTDHIGRFVPGSGTGSSATYGVTYAYPKHITVYNGEIVVMSRNDATLQRYDFGGNSLGSVATGAGIGQGMATDGTDLFVSVWNGSSSSFIRYNSAFAQVGTFANPTGMSGNTNVVDFAYDGATGNFFGLATNSEGGTGTQTSTVIAFGMGGAVASTHTLGFLADGIGQYNPVPEPATMLALASGVAVLLRRRKK